MAPCPLAIRFLWRSLLLAVAMLCAIGVRAQGIESVLRPGDVIQGHAKWEDDCAKCHVKFDRAGQDRLCMDCHKEVGQDMRGRTGYHGRLKPSACSSCHTDHKGRNARIAPLDKKQFDHTQTDYALRGAHQKVECDKCHVPPRKYREAPQDCLSCHRADDVHKGSLGAKCADCHTENKWTEAKFDHDKTRFALRNKHVDVKCTDCHQNNRYKDTPRNCYACHKKDDQSTKGHKGRFGERCDSCHDDKGWKPSRFNHDTDTKYVLRGKHRTTDCTDCHTGSNLYKDKVGNTCIDCHVKDDKHKGSLGKDCAACHTERDWKERAKFDHDKTRFPLLGKHRDTRCKDCHTSENYKEAPSDCLSCHKKDDKHEGSLGAKCGDCHDERDWKKAPRFEHDKTMFRLRNAHAAAKVKCVDCHANPRKFRDTSTECIACHKKDDKHEGTQGQKCEQCHDDREWKTTRFDHRLTRFPLLGRHVVVKCDECHKTKRYKDAPSDCYSCHKADDRHKLGYGTGCDACHNARGWGLWDFDHAKTRFVLDGKHGKIRCEACHSRPAPAGKKIFAVDTACVACHRRDDVHDGGFGAACERCHFTEGWKRIRQRVSMAPADDGGFATRYGAASYFARSASLGGPR